ncbi:d-3-phosphoglycerate dehydrogenase [Fusarium longipes]|uniref:D-3-phosphoglycerate dehydrogenase n=1 Tax=Fusarium longipes TaxID=694270 RepID=A0A395TBT1_9HYPO|nr:d-3-phosphoglycerate dehydrogenase [Fusarium longipes]
MTLIITRTNKTLKGHKAIILWNSEYPQTQVDAIQKQFPDLTIKIFIEKKHGAPLEPEFDDKEWENTTIILTAVATNHLLPRPDQVPHLQYIQLTSAGVDHLIKNPIFTDTKVPVCTASGVHGPQIAEWIVGTYLSHRLRLKEYSKLQDEGRWHRINDDPEDTTDTAGKRIIGRQTARLSKALGLDVHAYTLHPRNTPESRRDDSYSPPGLGDPEGKFPSKWFSGGSKEDIHAFLDSGLDIVVIALPLTDKTKGLISKPEFEIFSKKRTFVVNIARGPIVDTDDLIEALNSEKIVGAALDVTDPEPLPDKHPLWSAKNVIITPHISGNSSFYYKRLFDIFALNLERVSAGRHDLINKVNRREGY